MRHAQQPAASNPAEGRTQRPAPRTRAGTNIYTTFVVGLTLFKIVPRQTFGRIQSKLFPIYFNVTTGTNALVLATLLLSKEPAVQASTAAVTLGVTLLANLANQFVIEPQATKLMFAR